MRKAFLKNKIGKLVGKLLKQRKKCLFTSVLEHVTLQSGTQVLTKEHVYMHENISIMNEGGDWIFIADWLELIAGCIFFRIKVINSKTPWNMKIKLLENLGIQIHTDCKTQSPTASTQSRYWVWLLSTKAVAWEIRMLQWEKVQGEGCLV